MRKNEKHVILCLLEVARRGAKFGNCIQFHLAFARHSTESFAGMLAPMLIQMERQIDREIAADNKANSGTQTTAQNSAAATETNGGMFESDSDEEDENVEPVMMYGPQPQIVTNDLKSLDEMVSAMCAVTTIPCRRIH